MPRYEYRCDGCGDTVEQTRGVEERNQELGHLCEQKGTLKRVFTTPAHSIEGQAYLEYGGDPTDWFAG